MTSKIDSFAHHLLEMIDFPKQNRNAHRLVVANTIPRESGVTIVVWKQNIRVIWNQEYSFSQTPSKIITYQV